MLCPGILALPAPRWRRRQARRRRQVTGADDWRSSPSGEVPADGLASNSPPIRNLTRAYPDPTDLALTLPDDFFDQDIPDEQPQAARPWKNNSIRSPNATSKAVYTCSPSTTCSRLVRLSHRTRGRWHQTISHVQFSDMLSAASARFRSRQPRRELRPSMERTVRHPRRRFLLSMSPRCSLTEEYIGNYLAPSKLGGRVQGHQRGLRANHRR